MADAKMEMVRTTVSTSDSTLTATIADFGDVRAVIGFATEASVNDTNTADAQITVGFLDRQGTPNQGSMTGYSEDAQTTTDCHRELATTDFMRAINGTGADQWALSFNSWTTDGVVFNIDVNPGSTILVTLIFIGGTDATDSYFGSPSLGSTTLEQDITAPGFEPSVVFFASHGAGGSSSTSSQMCFGIAVNDGADTQGFVLMSDSNGQSTSSVTGMARNNRVAAQTFGSESWNCQVLNFDAAGFSVQTSASAGGDRLHYLAVKFANSPNLSLDFIDGPTSTGSYAVTDPGFTPGFVLLAMSDVTTINSPAGADGMALVGIDSNNTYCNAMGSEDGVTTSVCKSLSADSIRDLTGAASNLHVGTFTSFDSLGYTLNFTTVPGTARKWMSFALEGQAVAANTVGSALLNSTKLSRMRLTG